MEGCLVLCGGGHAWPAYLASLGFAMALECWASDSRGQPFDFYVLAGRYEGLRSLTPALRDEGASRVMALSPSGLRALAAEIKAWEADYFSQHGVKPTAAAIANADPQIRMYSAKTVTSPTWSDEPPAQNSFEIQALCQASQAERGH